MNESSASPVFESDRLLRIRRNPWILGIAMSPLLLALAALAERGSDARTFAQMMVALACFFTLFAYRANWRPMVHPVLVRADAEGAMLNGDVIARTAIRAALSAPGVAPRVVIRRRLRPSVELQMESQSEARALLEALGLDAPHAPVDFYGRSWVEAHWAYFLGGLLILPVVGFVCSKMGNIGDWLIVPLCLTVVVAWLLPTRLRVGADGIAIRWLWVHRFVGYGEIEDVARYEEFHGIGVKAVGLHIQHRSGVVRVPMGMQRWTFFGTLKTGETNIALAWERMREAAITFHQRGAAAEGTPAPRPFAIPQGELVSKEADGAAEHGSGPPVERDVDGNHRE